MRELFEDMNKGNARVRYLSPLLAIDETLHPYRGYIGLKQYNPNRTAKYGLLHHNLCGSSIPYTYYSLPYGGKLQKVEGPTAKYYITGTNEYSKYDELSVYCNLQGINISMDRYFTSVSLATQALEKNITIVDTMRHARKDIVKELKPVVDREKRSVIYVCNTKEKFMLVSYIVS